jgi:nucleotide-binding universal stress UspA family protein
VSRFFVAFETLFRVLHKLLLIAKTSKRRPHRKIDRLEGFFMPETGDTNLSGRPTHPLKSTLTKPLATSPVSNIVWALDAFPDQVPLQLKTIHMITTLFPNATIYPVYVLSEESFSDRGFSGFLRPALKPMAEKAMTALIEELGVPHIKRPKVLVEKSSSQAACARKLARFAEKINADLVALSSHGRKGFSRFILGSFAESLLSSSHLPTLLTGPRTEDSATEPDHHGGIHVSPPEAIVFPTDFSPACSEAFNRAIELARQFGAEIHIFHKALHIVDPFIQSGVHLLGGGWVTVENYMNPPPDSHDSEGQDWVSRAAASGVTARYVCENFREPISEAIVEYARHVQEELQSSKHHLNHEPATEESVENKKQTNLPLASVLIAMVPQAGPVASALLGSITHEVIRLSPCPLYLLPRP